MQKVLLLKAADVPRPKTLEEVYVIAPKEIAALTKDLCVEDRLAVLANLCQMISTEWATHAVIIKDPDPRGSEVLAMVAAAIGKEGTLM